MAYEKTATDISTSTDKSYLNPPVDEGTRARMVASSVRSQPKYNAFSLGFKITHTRDFGKWLEFDDTKYNPNVNQWLPFGKDVNGKAQSWKTRAFLRDAGLDFNELDELLADAQDSDYLKGTVYDAPIEGGTLGSALSVAWDATDNEGIGLNALLPQLLGVLVIDACITHRESTNKKGEPIIYQSIDYKTVEPGPELEEIEIVEDEDEDEDEDVSRTLAKF